MEIGGGIVGTVVGAWTRIVLPAPAREKYWSVLRWTLRLRLFMHKASGGMHHCRSISVLPLAPRLDGPLRKLAWRAWRAESLGEAVPTRIHAALLPTVGPLRVHRHPRRSTLPGPSPSLAASKPFCRPLTGWQCGREGGPPAARKTRPGCSVKPEHVASPVHPKP